MNYKRNHHRATVYLRWGSTYGQIYLHQLSTHKTTTLLNLLWLFNFHAVISRNTRTQRGGFQTNMMELVIYTLWQKKVQWKYYYHHPTISHMIIYAGKPLWGTTKIFFLPWLLAHTPLVAKNILFSSQPFIVAYLWGLFLKKKYALEIKLLIWYFYDMFFFESMRWFVMIWWHEYTTTSSYLAPLLSKHTLEYICVDQTVCQNYAIDSSVFSGQSHHVKILLSQIWSNLGSWLF